MILDVHKRYLWRFTHGILIVGVAFFVLSLAWPDAMRVEEYGAAAYAIPAEIWSLGFIAAAGVIIYGLHINGRQPLLTPIIRLVGIIFLTVQFGFLAWSAWSAPGGAVVFIFASLFFVPQLLQFIRVELLILAARWKASHNVAR